MARCIKCKTDYPDNEKDKYFYVRKGKNIPIPYYLHTCKSCMIKREVERKREKRELQKKEKDSI